MFTVTKPEMNAVERKQRVVELSVMIRKAALQLDPKGSITPLAQKAGLSYNSVMTSISRGYFSAGGASALEIAVGRDLLKKEDLAPHVYAKAGE